jgi:hypothetical protein
MWIKPNKMAIIKRLRNILGKYIISTNTKGESQLNGVSKWDLKGEARGDTIKSKYFKYMAHKRPLISSSSTPAVDTAGFWLRFVSTVSRARVREEGH